MSVALLVSSSLGACVTGCSPDGSWPRWVVTRKSAWAISVDCGVDFGSPGGGPGDLTGDDKEGVCRLISSMCCKSSLKALSGRL